MSRDIAAAVLLPKLAELLDLSLDELLSRCQCR
jgi:hypothetical protein